MIILGIDPGYATVGTGIVEYKQPAFRVIGYGAVLTPPKIPFSRRLEMIYDEITALITKYDPDAASVEELFFATNTKTAIAVAQARGVICLALQKAGVPLFEYTPLQVKSAVTGYGKADKRQVMEMTRGILGMKEIAKPDDASDALALAVCHAHSSGSAIAGIYRNFGYQKTE